MYADAAGSSDCCTVPAGAGYSAMPDSGYPRPRYTDRVIALNEICTLVIFVICILSYLLGKAYLVDVAILYGLLNLLAVAVLSRVTVERHRNRKEGKK